MKGTGVLIPRGLVLLGGILFFLGERMWQGAPWRPYVTGAGIVLLLGYLGWRLWVWWKWGSGSDTREMAAWEMVPAGAFVLTAATYLAGLLLPVYRGEGVDWAGILGWGWALSLTFGVVLFAVLELASRGGRLVPGALRARRAAYAGMFLALLLAVIATTNFIFDRLGWETDLTLLKTAGPSATTVELVTGLDKPVDVALVFPEDSEVPSLIRNYFQTLEKANPNLKLIHFDAELEPARARAFRVQANGTVVVRRMEVRKHFSVGVTPERARRALAKLDASFFGALTQVAREKKTAYFTTGHGETPPKARSERKILRSQRKLREILKEQNFDVKNLGLGEGLGIEVPLNAGLVVSVAPTSAFLPGEILALREYLERGGNLLAFLEPANLGGEDSPTGPGTLAQLLSEFGLVFQPIPLANDRFFVRYTYSKADRGLLATGQYRSNPFGNPRARLHADQPVLFLGAGAWSKGQPGQGMEIKEIVKGMPGTWGDANNNFEYDSGKEKRWEPSLVLATERTNQTGPKEPHPRVVAFADADFAMDFLMQHPANKQVISSALQWLAREGGAGGLPNSEEDVKILHVKSDELVWFYLPVFGVPLLVLAFGYFVSIRRKFSGE